MDRSDHKNGNGKPRKRKIEEEADRTNAILRNALGPRRAPASQQSRSKNNGVTKPTLGVAKMKAAEVARLRSLVDDRVEDWKSKQDLVRPPSSKNGSVGNGCSGLRSPLLLSQIPRAMSSQPSTSSADDGVVRRSVTEAHSDPARVSTKNDGKVKNKRRQPSQSSRSNGSCKHRTVESVSEDPVKVKIEDRSSADGENVGRSLSEGLPDLQPHQERARISQESNPLSLPPDYYDSSDGGGIS